MRITKSYWDKYASQRRAQRSRANLRRQRGIGMRRVSTPMSSRRAAR